MTRFYFLGYWKKLEKLVNHLSVMSKISEVLPHYALIYNTDTVYKHLINSWNTA